MKTHISLVMLAVVFSSVPLFASGGKSFPTKTYDLAASTYKGEQVRGPRTIKAINLNVLRYDYSWDSSVTFVAGPDLWKALTSAGAVDNAQSPQTTSKTLPKNPAGQLFSTKAMVLGAANACLNDASLKKFLQNTRLVYCEAQIVNENANTLIKSISQQNGEISSDYYEAVREQRTGLQGLLNKVNHAVDTLANAGADVRNLLQESSGQRDVIIVAGMKRRLFAGSSAGNCSNDSPDCIFLRGVGTSWPSADIILLLGEVGKLRVDTDKKKLEFQFISTESSSRIGLLKDRIQTGLVSLQGAISAEQKSKQDAQLLLQLDRMVTELQNRSKELDDAKADLLIDAASLDLAIKETDKTIAALADISETSSKFSSFRDAQRELVAWQQRMTSLYDAWVAYKADPDKNPDPFSLSLDGDSDFAFSQTKKTVLTLSRTDRMPGTKDTKPEAVLVVTVECTSPFAVTAGVAFSSIQEREFAIVPSSDGKTPPGVVNKFQSTAKSSFHPLPLAMVHARLWEPTEKFAVHASFGMAGNFRSQNSGGSDVEFLVGPSLSLFRTMFVTPGLHIGHKVSLGGGFNEGDTVPSSITQPPLQKSYKVGFGLAITFTKP